MKKIITILVFLLFSISFYGQMISNRSFMEIGAGAAIPSDNTTTFPQFHFEIGYYFNNNFGLGFEGRYGEVNNDTNDGLGYAGINFHLPFFYNTGHFFETESIIGCGYGWNSWDTGDGGYYYGEYYYDGIYDTYYESNRDNNSFIVPKVGLNLMIKVSRTVQVGLEPSYSWYISTNLDRSNSVGTFNILGKLRINIE
jgi:hypothetical protein